MARAYISDPSNSNQELYRLRTFLDRWENGKRLIDKEVLESLCL
jgi:hypothetical protein